MKRLAILVAAATMAVVVPVTSATACNNLGFVNAMGKAAHQATTAGGVAQNGDYSTAYSQMIRARRTFDAAPAPCASTLGVAQTQYGLALDYAVTGMSHAAAGRYTSAITAMKKANYWTGKATATLNRYNNR